MMRQHTKSATCGVIFTLLLTIPSFSQLEAALTIGSIKDIISNSLKDIQSITLTAGGEIKGAGNQLQANAQNVLRDIDSMFKDNLGLTFEKMDKQQQALYRDARSLASKLESISNATLKKGGEEARRALFEADILAYNTSYNIPCRNQNARIVYAIPSRIRVGRDAPEFLIRGNYLANSKTTALKVGGTEVIPISRNQGELRGRIDNKITNAVQREISIPIEVMADNIEKSSFLLWCPESIKQGVWQSTSITLLPERLIDIKAEITPTILGADSRTTSHRFDTGKPGDCGINQDVSRQICSADGWNVESFNLTNVSVNGGCGSTAGPATTSGNSCVHVPGRVQGCGWGFGAFGIRDCKGRGWVSWTLNVTEKKSSRKEAKSQKYAVDDSKNGNFTFRYEGSNELNAPQWSYIAQIKIKQGDREDIFEISNANNNSGPVSGRLVDGTLSVEVVDQE